MAAPYLVTLSGLMDDAKGFALWPEPLAGGRAVPRMRQPSDGSGETYQCKACASRFDDLTGTVLAGHHQPLHVGVACFCFMGLNLSNRQIAKEPGLCGSDVQAMTEQRRTGLVARMPAPRLKGGVEPDARAHSGIDEVCDVAGHKGQPVAVAKRGGSDAAAG